MTPLRKSESLPERCCERCLYLRYSGRGGEAPACLRGMAPSQDSGAPTGCAAFASEDGVSDWSLAYASVMAAEGRGAKPKR